MMVAGKGIINREISQVLRGSAEASTLLTRIFGFGLVLCRRLRAEHLFRQGKEFFGLRDHRGGFCLRESGVGCVITDYSFVVALDQVLVVISRDQPCFDEV